MQILGPEDIAGGNPKLIMGLLWGIIQRYQVGIGAAGDRAKHNMLLWLKAAVDENISKFDTQWNDGTLLQYIWSLL